MRHIVARGLFFLAACGGGTSSGPKLPGVDHILLVMDAGTVFTGQVIPSDQLVSLVIDSTGTAISNATISLRASPGRLMVALEMAVPVESMTRDTSWSSD